MKTALLLLTLGLGLAVADPQCPPGEVPVEDGNFWCGWIYPTNEFVCINTWWCESACAPYECAVANPLVDPPPVDRPKWMVDDRKKRGAR